MEQNKLLPPSPESPDRKKEERIAQKYEQIQAQLKSLVRQCFHHLSKKSENAADALLLVLRHGVKWSGTNPDVFRKKLLDVMNQDKEGIYIQQVMNVIEPIIRTMSIHVDELEKLEWRDRFPTHEPVNTAVEYTKPALQEALEIHLSPNQDLEPAELFSLINDGLKKLAIILKNDPKLKKVIAVSWIIDKYPTVIEDYGFAIINKNGYSQAEMSRDAFLKEYGSEEMK